MLCERMVQFLSTQRKRIVVSKLQKLVWGEQSYLMQIESSIGVGKAGLSAPVNHNAAEWSEPETCPGS